MFPNTLGLLFLSLGAHHILAGPVPEPQITAPAKLEERDLDKRVATCTFSSSNGASLASVSKTLCSTIILSALAVPSGTTLDLTGLNDGTHVIFEGETTFGVEQWTGPLVSISGTNIVVTGASGHSLNGNGGSYWDGEGGSGGSTKPKFFAAHSMTSATIQSVSIVNSPVQVFSINSCEDLALLGITINNSAGASLGKNTDGFDIGSSTGIYISGAYVDNQDDCVAINSGTNITFTGGTCTGGHGLSIGSVGGRSDNTVQSVLFESSTVENSQNGVRVKTIYGDTGLVADVTYKDITLSDITKYGIIIQQNYDDTSEPPSNGVTISALTLATVTGNVASSATDIAILCGSGSCEDWTWSHVTVTGGKKDASCTNVPSVASC